MTDIATALAPVVLLITLGFVLARGAFLAAPVWAGIERLTYYVLFPALLVATLARQDLAATPWPAMLGVILGVLTLALAALGLYRLLVRSVPGPTFTSIFQGGVRFNTYIALSVTEAFFGEAGLAAGSVALGFMIVLVNVLCIAAFARWGTVPLEGLVPKVRAVLLNPLIVACGIGWALGLSGIGLGGVAADVLEVLGRAALPLGLLAVGAALQPEQVRGHLPPAVVASVVQFGLKPAAAAVLIAATGLGGVAAAVLVIVLMTPTAPSSYILARQLGGDAAAMASIITLQTLLAFLVMPVVAWLMLVR